MNLDAKRWEQLAQKEKFNQLDGVRRQAEGWRTGLTGLTGLLAVVTVIKGPATVAGLTPAARLTVTVALGFAFAALVTGSLIAVRSASGSPRSDDWLTGQRFKAWTRREIDAVRSSIQWATVLLVLGLVALSVGVGTTFLGAAATEPVGIKVVTADTEICGVLIGSDGTSLALDVDPGSRVRRVEVRLEGVLSMTSQRC